MEEEEEEEELKLERSNVATNAMRRVKRAIVDRTNNKNGNVGLS